MFSRIPIIEFLSQNFSCFLLKQGRIFLFKRKQDIFLEFFLWIRRFGIRDNMSRAS